jgi:hypothetical protein
VSISVNGQDIALARFPNPNDKLYIRHGQLPMTAIASLADDAALALPAAELGRGQGGDVTLTMTGFTQAYAKLQNACAQTVLYTMTSAPQSTSTAIVTLPRLLGTLPNSTMERLPTNAVPHLEPIVKQPADLPAPGSTRTLVYAALGWPTETIGMVSLYAPKPPSGVFPSGFPSSGERKVTAAYFDVSGHLQHFARYVLKDGKVIDEINKAELSEGDVLPAVRGLLTNPPGAAAGAAAPPQAAPSQ